MKKHLDVFIDGACRGNPGEASIGVVIIDNGKPIRKISQAIGRATNNIAEYTALIYGLQEALMLKAESIEISTDSALLYHQIKGDYKIRDSHLKLLSLLVQHLLTGFRNVNFRQIRREENREADELASRPLRGQAKMVALRKKAETQKSLLPLFSDGEESPSSRG